MDTLAMSRTSFDERHPIDELVDLLNRLETIEAVAAHFDVNRRTIERAIDGKVERYSCWRLKQDIDVDVKAQDREQQ